MVGFQLGIFFFFFKDCLLMLKFCFMLSFWVNFFQFVHESCWLLLISKISIMSFLLLVIFDFYLISMFIPNAANFVRVVLLHLFQFRCMVSVHLVLSTVSLRNFTMVSVRHVWYFCTVSRFDFYFWGCPWGSVRHIFFVHWLVHGVFITELGIMKQFQLGSLVDMIILLSTKQWVVSTVFLV